MWKPTIAARSAHGLGLDRRGYYFFLRRAYGMYAWEALAYLNRMGTPPSPDHVRAVIADARAT